ncbi:MAG: hypothetical protein FRX49_01493 [Trebouxia sp. A1-2]|nr:MAG: hypothetical protein FRX49_01493 [Trebouxia sp. A1-2]
MNNSQSAGASPTGKEAVRLGFREAGGFLTAVGFTCKDFTDDAAVLRGVNSDSLSTVSYSWGFSSPCSSTMRAGKGRMAAAIFQQCKLFSGCPPPVHSSVYLS